MEIDTQEKFDALTEADAIILRVFKMTKEVVARIKGLKMIMRWGAGFDSVDVEKAGKRGIRICNTPGANAYAVAELTVALMLAVGRKLICHDRSIHQGEWRKNTFLNQTRTLNNKVVGIVGGGNIGRMDWSGRLSLQKTRSPDRSDHPWNASGGNRRIRI